MHAIDKIVNRNKKFGERCFLVSFERMLRLNIYKWEQKQIKPEIKGQNKCTNITSPEINCLTWDNTVKKRSSSSNAIPKSLAFTC